eukprot:g3197.t1
MGNMVHQASNSSSNSSMLLGAGLGLDLPIPRPEIPPGGLSDIILRRRFAPISNDSYVKQHNSTLSTSLQLFSLKSSTLDVLRSLGPVNKFYSQASHHRRQPTVTRSVSTNQIQFDVNCGCGAIGFFNVRPLEIARQFCLLDHFYFRNIQVTECLGQAWSKPKSNVTCPNIKTLIRRFNRVSRFTAYHILTSGSHSERLRVFCQVVRIAHDLRRNHQRLRMEMKKAGESGSASVPHLGIFLSDLSYIEEGNRGSISISTTDAQTNEEKKIKHVNFRKRRMVAGVLEKMMQYQDCLYPYRWVPSLAHFLDELPGCRVDKTDHFELSYAIEPKRSRKKTHRPK